jgi:transposase
VSLSQPAVVVSCRCPGCLPGLLPHLSGVVTESIEVDAGRVRLLVREAGGPAACPRCGSLSDRVHSRYLRWLRDLPVGGRDVTIRLAARRLFCPGPDCAAVTFAAQVQGLTCRYARRTPPLAAALAAQAVALAGRAGARLSAALGQPASRDSMIRLVMAQPVPEPAAAPEALGVDDFALRRGHVYGTVLVDMATGDAVDLLPDREAGTLRAWLEDHPGAKIICRDRAGAYADGARQGAPGCVQVADRWHLLHNLCQKAYEAAAAHRSACLGAAGRDQDQDQDQEQDQDEQEQQQDEQEQQQDEQDQEQDEQDQDQEQDEQDQDQDEQDQEQDEQERERDEQEREREREREEPPGAGGRPRRLPARTRERHAQIHQLLAAGHTKAAVARILGLSAPTVSKYANAATAGEITPAARESALDPHKPRLIALWNEGVRDARILHARITAQGYTGSDQQVRRFVRPFRALPGPAPEPPPATPSARKIAGWLMTRPGNLAEDDAAALAAALAACPHLAELRDHIRRFAQIMQDRAGETELGGWLAAAEASGIPQLRSFARGIRKDLAAVTAGLTLPWSSGKVEGNVNKIKMIKRQMYGRASFPLLRKRVLLS